MSFRKEDAGQSLVLTAIFMGFVSVGFLALAVDTGMLFRDKRIAQSAANAAALGAANEVAAGRTSNAQAVANQLATLNGLSVTPSLSTLTSFHGVNSQYVQVSVSGSFPTYFLGAFNQNLATLPVGASAIAGGSNSSSTCVCVEATSGQDLYVYGAGKIQAPTCGIVVDSTSSNAAVMNGASSINAMSVGVVSTSWVDSGSNWTNTSGTIQYTVPGAPSCGPTMPTAPSYNPASCTSAGGGSTTQTFGPASATSVICYTNLSIGYNGAYDVLNPGIYVITGNLAFEDGNGSHSNTGGNGVFFYLTSTAHLTINNGAIVSLTSGGSLESDGVTTAPSTGYNGVLFYQATGNTNTITLSGGSTSYLNGALYAPSANLSITGGVNVNLMQGIVVNNLTVNSASTLTTGIDTSGNENSMSVGSPRLVQ